MEARNRAASGEAARLCDYLSFARTRIPSFATSSSGARLAMPWQCGVVLLSHADHAARRGERRGHGTCFYLFSLEHQHMLAPPCQFRDRPLTWLRLLQKLPSSRRRPPVSHRTSIVVKQAALTNPLRWLSLPSADISICARSPRASTWRRRKHYAMSLLIPPAHLRTPSPPVP
jgi:hypothetical protein